MGADGSTFRVEGEYLEIAPPRLLVYSWTPSWCGSLKTVVRWELEPREVHGLQHRGPQKVGTGTVVKIRHSGFAATAPKESVNHAQGSLGVMTFAWMGFPVSGFQFIECTGN
jgi:uncharacterized protein YndB with AHSA1/START domain